MATTADQRRAEALRESETLFRTMADTAPVMIWMSDTEKRGTFFNKGWLDFTGRALEEELGEGWTQSVHPEDLGRCLAVCGGAFRARQPFSIDYRMRRGDGQYRWILDNGVPRHGPDGAFLGYIGSCIDITERREAELDSARQRSELARLSRVAILGELSGALAHELNQPLAAILSNAQAAQRLLAPGSRPTSRRSARSWPTWWPRTCGPARSSSGCGSSWRRARSASRRSTSTRWCWTSCAS
jgi:PAS domain S-box-containing protein